MQAPLGSTISLRSRNVSTPAIGSSALRRALAAGCAPSIWTRSACSMMSSTSAPAPTAAWAPAFHGPLSTLKERESRTRQQLLAEGATLRTELEALRLSRCTSAASFFRSRLSLARQAAVAVLAIGMPAISACQSGVSEMAPPPLKGTQSCPGQPVFARRRRHRPSRRRSRQCDDHHCQPRHWSDSHSQDQ